MKPTKVLKNHVGYWLNKLRNVVHYAFEERLAQDEVSAAEWCILVSVYDESAASINELTAYIEVDKASISRMVSRLVDKGLVQHLSGKDRRSGMITLTKTGLALMPKLIKEAEENEAYFFRKSLKEEELHHLQFIIHTLLSLPTNIELEGWLNINTFKENTMQKVKEILKEATLHKWPYPKTFETLKNVGLENYEVQFSGQYQGRFVGNFGEFVEHELEGYTPLDIAEHFNRTGLKNALIKHINEKTSYLNFLQEAANNGVSHYKVDMHERSVTYFNRDETQHHTEIVPHP